MTSNTGLIDFSPRWIVSRGRSATSRKCPLPNRNIVVSPRLLLADFGKKKRAAWILEPSATGLCEADLHVFAKFLEDRLERGLEARHFLGVRLAVTMSWISSSDTWSMSIWRGNQRRNRPLAFSTPPFCHEA
jgi:hypothetical protein